MATLDPKDQAELNRLYERYVELLKIAQNLSDQDARTKADAAKITGTLTIEIEKINKELSDTLFLSDSLANSFRETLAELKNQNVALQLGKSVFKTLVDLASALNYQQQGITDLNEKDFKKKQESLGISQKELENIQSKLSGANKESYIRQSIIEDLEFQQRQTDGLTLKQQRLLEILTKERNLLEAVNNTIEEGIPSLQEELNVSKLIYDVRKDIGGLAGAAAGVVSRYGKDLAQFLKVDDAVESVKRYNRELIDNELNKPEVIRQLKDLDQQRWDALNAAAREQRDIEREIAEIQRRLDASTTEMDRNRFKGDLNSKKLELLNAQKTEQENINRIEKAASDIKKQAIRDADTLSNRFKSLGVLVKELGVGLKKAFSDPLTIISFLIDSLLKASSLINDLQKNLGISYSNAYLLNNEMAAFAAGPAMDSFITVERLNKSMVQLVQTLGFVPAYGMRALESFTNLTEKIGLSAQEASSLVTFARAQGENTETILTNMGRIVTSMNLQKGTAITLKQILSDVANVSKATAVSLGMNPELITRAATAARQLGLNLEQVDKIAESLLNFESSIDNELQAELLTGKEINLERARAFALANDLKGVSDEIGKNQEVINTFASANRVAQEAIAKSLGMSREDLAKMIYQQEAQKIGAEGVRRKYGEQAYESLKAQAAQERFANAIEKLKSVLSSIVGLLAPIIDAIAWLADRTWVVYTVFGLIAASQIPRIVVGMGTLIGQSIVLGRNILGAFKWSNIVGFFTNLRTKFLEAIALSSRIQPRGIPAGSTFTTSRGIQVTRRVPTTAPVPPPVTPPTPTPTPTPGPGGGGLRGFLGGINVSSMLQGAVALLALSGALFITAKAFQEFSKVEWKGVVFGTIALTGLTIAARALDKVKKEVIQGALAIGILGTALIPASIAFKMFSDVKWEGVIFGTIALTGLTIAIRNLGDFSGSIYKGAAAIALLGAALLPAAYAFQVFGEVKWEGVVSGIVALTGLTIAANTLGNYSGSIYKGAAAIALLGVSIIPAAYAFKIFGEVKWEGVTFGTIALTGLTAAARTLGNYSGSIYKGAAAIALLGASIIPAAYAFQLFSNVDWAKVVYAGIALGALSGAAAVLGMPVVSELILTGAVVIAALGAALIPFAIAVRIATPAMEALGNTITKVFDGIAKVIAAATDGIIAVFTTLQNIDVSKLLAIGPALFGISAGLAALSIVGNISSLFNLLGGGPLSTLTKLAALSEPLNIVAVSLKDISKALTEMTTSLSQINTAKLKEISTFSADMQKSAMLGSIGTAVKTLITAPIKAVSSLIGTTEPPTNITNNNTTEKLSSITSKEKSINTINTVTEKPITAANNTLNEPINAGSVDLTPMIAAINEVKTAVTKLSSQTIVVNMDGRKVGYGSYNASYKSS